MRCKSELIHIDTKYLRSISATTVYLTIIVFVNRKLVMLLQFEIVDRGSDNDTSERRCGLFVCSSSSMKTGTQIHVNLVVTRERDEVLTLYHTRRIYSSSRASCTRGTYFG